MRELHQYRVWYKFDGRKSMEIVTESSGANAKNKLELDKPGAKATYAWRI